MLPPISGTSTTCQLGMHVSCDCVQEHILHKWWKAQLNTNKCRIQAAIEKSCAHLKRCACAATVLWAQAVSRTLPRQNRNMHLDQQLGAAVLLGVLRHCLWQRQHSIWQQKWGQRRRPSMRFWLPRLSPCMAPAGSGVRWACRVLSGAL